MEYRMVTPQSPLKLPPRSKPAPIESQSVIEMIERLKSASSSSEMEISCQSFYRYFNHELKAKRKQISEQMAFLKKEKEEAIKEYNQREEDVKRLKHQLNHLKTEYKLIDKQRVKTLQSQLQATINEREEWKAKATDLEDVCESLRLVNTLQRNLASEKDEVSHYEQRLLETQDELRLEREKTEVVMQERDNLNHELLLAREQLKRLQKMVDNEFKNEFDTGEQSDDASYV